MRVKEIIISTSLTVDQLIELIKIANTFESDINIKSNYFTVDAKSLMGVITMITAGTEVILTTKGEDEEVALKTISDCLVRSNSKVT